MVAGLTSIAHKFTISNMLQSVRADHCTSAVHFTAAQPTTHTHDLSLLASFTNGLSLQTMCTASVETCNMRAKAS